MKTKIFRAHFGFPEAARRVEEMLNAFLEENQAIITVIDIKFSTSSASPPQTGPIVHSVTALLLYQEIRAR
jgi:hypothetical protein